MIEEWRPVPGFNDRYEVSSLGRVRSWTSFKRGGLLKAKGSSKGYLRVCFTVNYEKAYVSLHRLVLEVFVGPCPDGYVCRHLNGNPADNRVENLQWGTSHENALDRRAHGTDHNVNKTHCPQGHPYDADNTEVHRGSRRCRICRREQIKLGLRRKRGSMLPATGERTHCPRGHEYSPENTRISPRGARYCRQCERVRTQQRARANRDQQAG